MTYTYRKGITTGRPMTFLWQDATGATIDFTSGYTFAAYVVDRAVPGTLLLTKTTTITGSIGSAGYNVLIDWAPADFTPLTGGKVYAVTLVATPSGGDPFAFPGKAEFVLEVAPV